MTRFQNLKQTNRVRQENGQTMSEYAVVLLFLCVATVASFGVLSESVASLVNSVVGLLP